MQGGIITRGDSSAGAQFSADEAYRYLLWRRWGDGPLPVFIMLNPSTADESVLDPTVTRCRNRVESWGYPGIVVANLFALRSTDPGELYRATDPVGPANDDSIIDVARAAPLVVCGWGTHGAYMGRGGKLVRRLTAAGVPCHCLGTTKGGYPRHPLYVPYSQGLEPFHD